MKTTFLTLFFAFLFCLNGQSQNCLPDGIKFITQAQIDNFSVNYPGCTVIEGDVQISGDDITNLNGLQNVTSIGGDLNISNISHTGMLTSLSGLQNITSIGGSLTFYNNFSLTSLSGLENVTLVGGYLNISYNFVLTNLNGLENITSVGSYLLIEGNSLLTSLNGLENLTSVGSFLDILDNQALTSLSGLENLTSIEGDISFILGNPLLSDCAVFAICNQLLNGTDSISISNNAPGCNSPAEVETQCKEIPIVVEVQMDNNGVCSPGTLVSNLQVRLQGAAQITTKPTDANGAASFAYLESGPFTLLLPEVNDDEWDIAQFTQALTASNGEDSFHVLLCLSPLTQCPELTASLGLPSNFRGCLVNSEIQVSAQNTGTALAEGVKLAVAMPSVLDLLGSVPPIASQNGDTLFFEMGDIEPFETATATLTVKTRCDTFLFGHTLCVEAFAGLNNPCPNNPPGLSEVKLSAQCIGDSLVRFYLKNIGEAPTQGPHKYAIIKNEDIIATSDFSLDVQETLTVDVPADGATFRMEATKFDDGTLTATAIENCRELTPGLITAFWLDRGSPDYDFDCRQVIGSYDPNQKTAVPTGTGSEGLVVANHALQYTIDFQNTGTDTAFRVLLRDVLPEHLDISTFRPGFSSHPCTWEIRDNLLEVLFFPIMLPDSNVNEPASHGYFSFTVDQKPDLPNGTVLYNTASIIFDFNPPIVTNTVRHTIGQLTVDVDKILPNLSMWRVWGNPLRDAAVFRTEEYIAGEKRFELYDAAGRLVRATLFSGQEFEFQRGILPGGLYFFKIGDAKGRMFAGKIVLTD